MTTLYAKDLTLIDVHRRFGFQRQFCSSFEPLLSLEPLTEFEQQELRQIRNDFDQYLLDGKVLEGMIKLLTVFPLLRLTGFYRYPIKLRMEESIGRIHIEDEDTNITGRFDLIAVDKSSENDPKLWIIVVEAKNSDVDPRTGVAQLLTYAYQSLKHQDSVWGLATNGQSYQFVHIQAGNPPTYEMMPFLNLIDFPPPDQLVQVLKAIRQV
jgi:hypothetical protein